MSKQKFCLPKDLKSNFIFVLSAVAIILFGFAIILPTVPANTFAEGDDPNEGIVITISPEINVSLLSSENGDYKIVKDTVTIGTDALNGYTLYISTDTPQHQTLYLNGDTSSENKIDGANGTYESPKALGDYEWGFAVPGVGHFDDAYSAESPNEDSKFAILPTENKIIRDYTTSASEDAAEVYYGFKLGGTIEPGAYETNITYTAIPATQPLVAKAVLSENGNLNFLYNRNTYTVGEIYEDNIEETTIKKVFMVPTNSTSENDIGWASNLSITSANFEPSFYNFKPTSTSCWFYGDEYLGAITKTTNLNTSNVTNMSNMFRAASYNAVAFNSDLSSWDVSNVTDMSNMFLFAGSNSLAWTVGNLDDWDVGSVTNMSSMFKYAGYHAGTWSIGDLSGWDVGNVTDMSHMFDYAGYNATTWNIGNLNYIDEEHKGWNVNNVTDHTYFVNWYQTNIDLSKLPWQSN